MAPTIVLLHGFTNTGASWDPVVTALGERYRALAPDIRGHGTASDRRPVSLSTVLDDIDALAPPCFTLAGYSMGGRIALHAALAWPQRVERLVLIGSSPGIADPRERAARRRTDDELADEVSRSSIEEFAARWALTPVLAGQEPAVAGAAHRDRLRSSAAGLAAALRGLGPGVLPSLWDRLGEVTAPVTLIVGEHDPKFTEIAQAMRGLIPRARVKVVGGAGHAVHLEAPDAVAGLLAEPGPQGLRPGRTS